MQQITHIFFDLDGTLTDPQPGITAAIRYALHQLGRADRVPDDLDWCIGPPLRESFAQLLGSDEPQLLDQALAWYRERYHSGKFENAVYPGVPAMLATLLARGYQLFVATSKPAIIASEIVAHFGLARYFSAIYGSELDGRRTDKAELLLHLLQRERLDPRACLMVGDRRHDVVAARAHSVRAIGVSYGYGSLEELRAAGADQLVARPEALLDLLGAVGARGA